VLATCFPQQLPTWEPRLKRMIPSYGTTLSEKPKVATKELKDTAKTLGLAV
jgi:malate dehydrogenase (quinone)